MRPEIFDTFEIKSGQRNNELPTIGLTEIKEAAQFIAGLAMQVIKASREVAEKNGLRALGKELKSLTDWKPEILKK